MRGRLPPVHILAPPHRASFILMRQVSVRYLCKGNGKCVIVIVAAGLARLARSLLASRQRLASAREQLLQQNPSMEEEESKGQPQPPASGRGRPSVRQGASRLAMVIVLLNKERRPYTAPFVPCHITRKNHPCEISVTRNFGF